MELTKKEVDIPELIEAIRHNCDVYEVETTHDFHGGMYMRTFYPKKNTVVVGKLHKKDGYGVLLSGCLYINGTVFNAPHVFKTAANSRNIGKFLDDSSFASFDVCESTNVEDAELEMFYGDDVMEDNLKEILCLQQ